jgi:hypothetical protein
MEGDPQPHRRTYRTALCCIQNLNTVKVHRVFLEVGVPAAAERLIQWPVILLPVADDRPADSGIPSLFVTPTVHNRSYKSPAPAPALSQPSPVHALTQFLLDPLKITSLPDVTSCTYTNIHGVTSQKKVISTVILMLSSHQRLASGVAQWV